MAKIFLSVPILGRPELKMIYSMYRAILSTRKHQIRLYFNEGDSLISRVRNVHISQFLYNYTENDYFMSWDSDLETLNSFTENNIFDKLIAADKDFVGGLYAIKKPGVVRCSSIAMNGDANIQFDNGLIPMRWLSSGCWMIKRKAVEKMAEAYPELTYDGDDNAAGQKVHGLYIPYIYEMTPKEFPQIDKPFKKYLSEDWAFPVHPDTNVLCSGFVNKKIKDINIGEDVIGFDEFPRGQKRQLRIAKVKDKIFKKLPMFKITTENGEVITTGEHKWLIKRGLKNRFKGRLGRKNGFRLENPCKSKWEETKNLQIGDFIYRPFRNIYGEIDDNYKKGYIRGVWDGDGNVYKHKKYDSFRCSLRVIDMDILLRTSEYLSYFGIKNSIKRDININYKSYNPDKYSKLHGIIIGGKEAKKVVRFLESADCEIFENDAQYNFMRGYLAGIFDAEGNYDGSSIGLYQYKEVNGEIWRKIARALDVLGISYKSDKKRHRITSCKNIHDFFMLTTPSCQRKLHIKGQKKGKGNLIMPQYKEKIVKIESTDEGDVICLVTETGTFVANGYASHNCARWKDIGGEIWADTSIILKHHGVISYDLFNVEMMVKSNPPPAGFDLEKK